MRRRTWWCSVNGTVHASADGAEQERAKAKELPTRAATRQEVPGPVVCVFGSSRVRPGEELYQTAWELGRVIAQAGWTLCNGGYEGTMAAGARGALSAGGWTVGVTCRALGRRRCNRYIRQEIRTADLFERLRTLLELGQAYVVLPGASGTLLELAAAIELHNKRLLQPTRPIIVLGDYWEPALSRALSEGSRGVRLQVAASPDEVGQILAHRATRSIAGS